MDRSNSCGCKGYRTCLHCENEVPFSNKLNFTDDDKQNAYVYCPYCNKAYPGWDVGDYTTHPEHKGDPVDYPGVYINLNFLNESEEDYLIKEIDRVKWDLSQSGRRKQNYGPKCNFKKRKLKVGEFSGFPKFSQFVQDKFKAVNVLKDFQTIEQCSLEYNPQNGASIDPHVDDCWIWGERIITVNLISDSVLTMTPNMQSTRYNLDCVEHYPSVLNEKGDFNQTEECFRINEAILDKIVRIPMPRRSLLVMYNSARYDWEHQVLREDIKSRRVCIAYREFTPNYLPTGSNYEEAKPILENALVFT